MPTLAFRVESNYDEVRRLRTEIGQLEDKLRNFSPGGSIDIRKKLEQQLAASRAQFTSLVSAAQRTGQQIDTALSTGVDNVSRKVTDMMQMLSNPINASISVVGLGALGMLVDKMATVRSQFQNMETSINVLLGSERKGKQLFSELTEFAKVSPLQYSDTVSRAQMMLGFGIEQSKVVPYLKAIGDISMGDRQNFNSLSLAFSQMSAAGKLMGQDLMQMVNAGFQPLQVISEKTGKSIGQLKEEMSKGKISAQMVQQAFLDATSAGGKYYQMSSKASQTIGGQLSMLEDSFDALFNDLGKEGEGVFLKLIEGATYVVDNFTKVLPTLERAIVAFGIYKALAVAASVGIKHSQEEQNRAFVEGIEKQIELVNKAREADQKRAEEAARRTVGMQSDKGITRARKYDYDEANAVIEEARRRKGEKPFDLEENKKGLNRVSDELANVDVEIEARSKSYLEAKDKYEKARSEFMNWDGELQAYDADGGMEGTERNALVDGRGEAEANMNKAKAALDQEKGALSSLRETRRGLTEEVKEYSKAIEAETSLTSENTNIKNAQLAKLREIRDSMTSTEAASDFGQQVNDQIQAIENSLNNVTALDSDLQQAVDLGVITRESAEYTQQMSNGLDDLISKLGEEEEALRNAMGIEEPEELKGKIDRLKEEIASLEEESESLFDAGDTEGSNEKAAEAKEKQAEVTRLETLEEERNSVATRQNELVRQRQELTTLRQANTERARAIATRNGVGATTAATSATATNTSVGQKNVVMQKLHQAGAWASATATRGLAAAQGFLSKVTMTVTGAFRSLWATMAANPIGMVVMAGMALFEVFKHFSEDNGLSDAAKQIADDARKSVSDIQASYAILETSDKSSKTYKDALNNLTQAAKEYGVQIKDEIDTHTQLIAKKQQLIGLIQAESRERLAAAQTQSMQDRLDETQNEFRENLMARMSGRFKEQYADQILEFVRNNAEKVKKYYEELDSMGLSDDERDNRFKDYISQSARETARRLGDDTFELDSLSIMNPSSLITQTVRRNTMDFIDDYTEASKKMEVWQNSQQKSLEVKNALTDATPELTIKEMDTSKAVEKAKEATKELANLQETAKKLKIKMDDKPLADVGKKAEEAHRKIRKLDGSKAKVVSESNFLELLAQMTGIDRNLLALNDRRVSIKADGTDIQKVETAAQDALGSVISLSTANASPGSDTSAISGLNTEAVGVKESVDSITDTTATPGSNNADLEETREKADTAIKGVADLDKAKATPKVNTVEIDILLQKLNLAKSFMYELNGEKFSAYLTAAEQKEYNDLKARLKQTRNANGSITYSGTTAEIQRFRYLKNRAEQNGQFKIGDQTFSLDERGAQVKQALYAKYAKTEKDRQTGQMTRVLNLADIQKDQNDWELYQSTIGASVARQQRERTRQAIQKSRKIQRETIEKLKTDLRNVKTDNQLSELKANIKNLMPDLDHDSQFYKELEKLQEQANKKFKKNTKKGGGSKTPREQLDYEWRKQMEQTTKAFEKEARENWQRRRDAEIEAMDEGTAKAIAAIYNNAQKERDALDEANRSRAEQLESQHRALWKKQMEMRNRGKKNAKVYDYQFEEAMKKADRSQDPLTYSEYLAKAGATEDEAEKKKLKTREEYYKELFENVKAYSEDFYEKLGREMTDFDAKLAESTRKMQRELEKALRGVASSMSQYLRQFGSTQEKLLAIRREYEAKLAEKPDMSAGERMSLERQRRADESKVQADSLFAQIDWQTAFSDLHVVFYDSLRTTYDQLREYVKTDDFKNRDLADQKAVYEQLEKARVLLRDSSRMTAEDIGITMAALREAHENLLRLDNDRAASAARLAAAEEALNRVNPEFKDEKNPEHARYVAAQQEYDAADAAYRNTVSAYDAESTRSVELQQSLASGLQGVNDQMSRFSEWVHTISSGSLSQLWDTLGPKMQMSITGFLTGGTKVKKGIETLSKSVNDGENSWEEMGQQVKDGMGEAVEAAGEGLKKVGDTLKKLFGNIFGKDLGEEMASNATAKIGKAVEAGEKATDATESVVGEVAGNTEGAAKEAGDTATQKASNVGGWIGLAISILGEFNKDGGVSFIQNITSSIAGAMENIIGHFPQIIGETFKGIGKSFAGLFGSIFGGGESDKTLHDDMEALTYSQDALRKSIEMLADEMKEASVAESVDLLQKQIKFINLDEKKNREILERQGASHSSSEHSTNYKVDKKLTEEDWNMISSVAGERVGRMWQLLKLSPEQLNDIQKYLPTIWAQILQTSKEDGHDDISERLQDETEYAERLKDAWDAFREKVTSTTFDNVRSEFASLCSDMTFDLTNFGKSFDKIMQNLMINNLLDNKYNERIKKWYEKLADYGASGGEMTFNEMEELKGEYMGISAEMTDEMKTMRDMMGWDNPYTQSGGSAKAVEGITQDQADEISGRLTAVAESTEAIRQFEAVRDVPLTQMTAEMVKAAVQRSEGLSRIEGIQDQIAKCHLEMISIRENTEAVVKPIQNMATDMAEMKTNIKKLI